MMSPNPKPIPLPRKKFQFFIRDRKIKPSHASVNRIVYTESGKKHLGA